MAASHGYGLADGPVSFLWPEPGLVAAFVAGLIIGRIWAYALPLTVSLPLLVWSLVEPARFGEAWGAAVFWVGCAEVALVGVGILCGRIAAHVLEPGSRSL
jgi:hypothetical protein